jgi:hypothetical protein
MSDTPWPAPVQPAPQVEIVPSPPERSRRTSTVVAAVVAVVALGAAALFAVSQVTGNDDGGAASPEDVGTSLLAALEDEDALGVIDLLLPGERDVVRDPLVQLVSDLGRLDVLSDDATLSDVAGFDIDITDEQVDMDATNVDDITNLHLTGTVTATIDGEALPLGDVLLERVGDADPAAIDETDTTPFDLPITTVEHDGRWYLSMFFTAAEQLRGTTADAPAIPTAGIEPIGGATPEDALDELLAGVEALDVERLVAALNPGEAAALQRYAPLFLDDATAGLGDVPLSWDIAESEYTVTGDGGRRHATVDVLVVEGELEGAAFELELVDGCWHARVPADGLDVHSCELADQPADELDDQLDDLVGDSPEVAALLDLVEEVFADLQLPGVTLVRTDGDWYVSPLGTVLDQLLAVSGALDRAELDELIDTLPAALDALGGLFFGAAGGPPFDDLTDDLTDDPLDPAPDVVPGDTMPDETVPGDTIPADAADDPLTPCYEQVDAAAATACFRTAIAAGAVEAPMVPVEMRYPECGMAEQYWEGYGALGDAEFFALVDAARPCFLELVTSGEVEEWELGYEYTHPECFEGRNWYAVFDDPDYDERFSACVGA